MKTYNEFISEGNAELIRNAKIGSNVIYSEPNRRVTPINHPSVKNHEVIGWFSNKSNPAFGWVIHKLDSHDISWLRSKSINPKGIYRVASEHGSRVNTSLIKLNFKTGTYAFLDNKYLEDTDEIRFDKMVKAKKIVLDVYAETLV